MRRYVLAALLGASLPAALAAQSSSFTARGPGLPGRSLSTRSVGMGGAFGLFDPESGLNPGALALAPTLSASFNGVQEFRSVSTPAGDGSVRDARFPMLGVVVPFNRRPLAIGLHASTYTNRDFGVARLDTIDLRGVPVEVRDTIVSEGGLTDLRLAASYDGLFGIATVGVAAHVITGRDRVTALRSFDDENYQDVAQRAELSSSGFGISVGTVVQLGSNLWAAGVLRNDGTANVDRDSTRLLITQPLPALLGGGLRWRPSAKLDVAAQALYRTWGEANDELVENGAPGTKNTIDLSVGVELVRNARRASQLPLRAGARFATLPVLVDPDTQPREFGLTLGSGFRFSRDARGNDRAGIDFALERVWRSAGDGRSEGVWLVWVGGSVRP